MLWWKNMKIGMIVCWIGKLPDYFDLWEYSCSKNEDYDFFVFTDNPRVQKFDNIKFDYEDSVINSYGLHSVYAKKY